MAFNSDFFLFQPLETLCNILVSFIKTSTVRWRGQVEEVGCVAVARVAESSGWSVLQKAAELPINQPDQFCLHFDDVDDGDAC